MIVTIKTILILTIFLIFSISVVLAHDVNETVDGDGIDNDDSTISNMADITTAADKPDESGTIKDLASEIDSALAGSVIDLSKDYNGDFGSQIRLNKDLTIDGQDILKNINKEKNSVLFDFKPLFGENTVTIHYKDYTLSKEVNIEHSLSS